MNDNDKFDYVYSAPTEEQRKEIESIKSRYVSQLDVKDGLEQLRKLNGKVYRLPLAVAWTTGIAALLIFGLGITLVLQWHRIICGCLVGAAGILLMTGNYFLYRLLLKKRKDKYGKRIVELSDSLLDGDKR